MEADNVLHVHIISHVNQHMRGANELMGSRLSPPLPSNTKNILYNP